ncbi:MAG: hypothetical protein ACXWWU_11670 [Candidatus Limnocylindria bacterium]
MIPAAILAVVLLVAITAFQLALAFGAPWGAAAWGGQSPGVLPQRLRIASGVVALVVYPLIIALVLASAGIIDDGWRPVDGTVVMWGLAGLLGLGAVMNVASRSRPERAWGAVALTIALCCALIALKV